MTAKFGIDEILEITKGRLAAGLSPDPDKLAGISTDTRSLGQGQWYLALSGERFDGHDFLGDAYSAGATGAIVANRQHYAIGNETFPLIVVDDTLLAYHALANEWRRRVNPKVVAITGSSGKTTTKEMVAAVFGTNLLTHKSQANENNEIGLAKTILAMSAETQVLVLELAMRGLGEIDLLARTSEPDVGIIVNVGSAHLGRLETLENIIRAKCELLENLDPSSSVAILGHDDAGLLARAKEVFKGKTIICREQSVKEVSVDEEGTVFEVDEPSLAGVQFSVRAHGQSHLQDAWCAVLAGSVTGLSFEQIAKGLGEYMPVAGRGNRLIGFAGAVIIDESYNANPDSVMVAVNAFLNKQAYSQGSKYVVLGELAELGDTCNDLHQQLGKWLKTKDLKGLLTVGKVARHIAEGAQGASFEIVPCADQLEAEMLLKKRLSNDAAVLIKGSHSARLDKLVTSLAK